MDLQQALHMKNFKLSTLHTYITMSIRPVYGVGSSFDYRRPKHEYVNNKIGTRKVYDSEEKL